MTDARCTVECDGHPQENPSAPPTGGKAVTLCVLARAAVTPYILWPVVLLIESAANVQKNIV